MANRTAVILKLLDNTENFGNGGNWDVTLQVVTAHAGDETGTRSVSHVAGETKNHSQVALNTYGKREKHFLRAGVIRFGRSRNGAKGRTIRN